MSLPYFRFYPKDYHAKTSHLTLEEDGAYNRLLRILWMMSDCSIPDDHQWIMRRMTLDKETYARVVLPLLDDFFERKDGRISNPRLTEEFDYSNTVHAKRVAAGKKGGKANSLKNNGSISSNVKTMLKQPEPEPEPEPELKPELKPDRIDNNSNELSSSIVGSTDQFNFLAGLDRCRDIARGCLNDASPNLVVQSELRNWIANGCDFEADIVPAIESVSLRSQGRNISSWSYFSNAVYEAKERRIKPALNVSSIRNFTPLGQFTSHKERSDKALNEMEEYYRNSDREVADV